MCDFVPTLFTIFMVIGAYFVGYGRSESNNSGSTTALFYFMTGLTLMVVGVIGVSASRLFW